MSAPATWLSDDDLHRIAAGTHPALANALGAHPCRHHQTNGVRFAVWAPNAREVSVIGDFNAWEPSAHPMVRRPIGGVWECFVSDLPVGALYKYAVVDQDGCHTSQRADPLARQTEMPPGTASVVTDAAAFTYTDHAWMGQRAERHAKQAAISIYEVHPASWRHAADGGIADWASLATTLIPYVVELGFTHIELLPIMEHPFGGSWGYQPLGMFAPSARYGPPAGFAAFVDRCHGADIGVILDWVPAHFPADPHGLARFDGTALYEHIDPREGYHPDWHTLIYNLGRNEVRNFLMASALEWLERYHVDGLRVDAVASMLYRDYSRRPGQWVPNVHGGRENLEAIDFLRSLNRLVAQRCPGAMMIAEESTAWPGVTAPVERGGLGFDYKWNMGWMHDTLRYMRHDPIYRSHHHHDLTFSLVYAWSEHFVLALSHDEVVHGKASLLSKMPGDDWQRMANLRAYYGYMWTHPGRKLLFMGSEFAQPAEWNHDQQLHWALLEQAPHQGVHQLIRDLNALYRELPALHALDDTPAGFRWVIGDDNENSVFAYLRCSDAQTVLVVCNMTPVPRRGYRIGVPVAGWWQERLNTDADIYGGSGVGNAGGVATLTSGAHGYAQSVELTLPPLATLILQHRETAHE